MPDHSTSARKPLKHLLLCREYPPAPYPAGGIGTYARHIAQLLAEAGETVHVISQRWDGAPEPITQCCDGRLTIHRIPLDAPIRPTESGEQESALLRGLASSTCPAQLFSWQAARYAERLIEEEGVDVIEAQEWEAPLYFLQLRRMLGLGPERKPPCIVHLHSPTQMIFTHNAWDKTLVDYLPLSRFEEFTIRAADSLICPSRYLAQGVAELFKLSVDSISIIRYPMGDTPTLSRGPEVWSRNAICYVGRLELRKGVVEWVDAAIEIASANNKVMFHFFGSDTTIDGGVGESVLAHLRRRIPRMLRRQFHFHGSQSRAQLLQALASFPIAVVPSRWENLPFTCIEAMATGLPVIVSPNGGMAELIVDGESGWLAKDGSAHGLAEALARALAASATMRAAYGARAAESVRRVCANDRVVASHLEHRDRVAGTGANQSLTVPGNTNVRKQTRYGSGFVATCSGDPNRLAATIASIRSQTETVCFNVVLNADFRGRFQAGWGDEVNVLYVENFSSSAATRIGLEALLTHQSSLQGVTILDHTMRLAPNFAAVCDDLFRAQPGVGLISSWVLKEGADDDLDTGPLPLVAPAVRLDSLPYGCAIRIETVLSPEMEGWSAVTYPESLLFVHVAPSDRRQPRRRYSGMALIQNPSAKFALNWLLALPLGQKASWITRVVLHPHRIARWIVWQLSRRTRHPSGNGAA